MRENIPGQVGLHTGYSMHTRLTSMNYICGAFKRLLPGNAELKIGITVMKNCLVSSVVAILSLLGLDASGQGLFDQHAHLFTMPRHYMVYRVSDSLRIDGRIDEAAWNNAQWSDYFIDIEGAKKPKPAYRTRFKMLWNNHYLYVAAELEEPHVWGNLKEHDQIVYHDNDFEVFIDPDGDTHNYYEIEVNALNTIFDLFLPRPYRNGGSPNIRWNANGLRSAVHIDGTLNDPSDTDRRWSVELAIPFRSLSLDDTGKAPADKSIWRMNFSRVQWQTLIDSNKYKKKMDSLRNRPLPENNWVWSPQGVINMHFPERWGYVQFNLEQTASSPESFRLPPSEQYKPYLWLLYYKQREYYQRNRKFAATISELGIPGAVTTRSGKKATIKMQAENGKYVASIQSGSENEHWEINNEGKITKPTPQP